MADRRAAVSFDPDYFAREAARGQSFSPTEAFRHAFQTNLWGGAESPSGPGSSLDETARLQQALPGLLQRLGIRTLLDLPCGDGHWIASVALPGIRYIGADLPSPCMSRKFRSPQ